MTGQTGLQLFAGVVSRLGVDWRLYIAVYTKVARGLACGSPGDQRGLVK